MHKIFAFIYLIFILICIGFGIQMFIERGVGIIDSENIISGISNFIKDGKNVLMLIPSGNFEIESLVVSLE